MFFIFLNKFLLIFFLINCVYYSYNKDNKLNLLILIYKILYKKENINLIII